MEIQLNTLFCILFVFFSVDFPFLLENYALLAVLILFFMLSLSFCVSGGIQGKFGLVLVLREKIERGGMEYSFIENLLWRGEARE